MSDELTEFALRFMSRPLDTLFPVAVNRLSDEAITLVLYREPPFQVELVILTPGSALPREHRHPNVDSIEVHFCGEIPIPFTKNGELATPMIRRRPSDRESRNMPPLFLHSVAATDWHGAHLMPQGAAFLSIQRWLNGADPASAGSVGYDWEGPPLGKDHERKLVRPYPPT